MEPSWRHFGATWRQDGAQERQDEARHRLEPPRSTKHCKPVLAMNGKRVSFAPQSEHPDTSLELFSEILFVLSCMSFRRVLWGRGDRPRSARPFAVLAHSLARLGAMLGHLGAILRHFGDKMEPKSPKMSQDNAQESQHEPT